MARDWSPEVAVEEGIGAGNRQEDDDDDDLVLLQDGLVVNLREHQSMALGVKAEGTSCDSLFLFLVLSSIFFSL
jgi:hypothetical protein